MRVLTGQILLVAQLKVVPVVGDQCPPLRNSKGQLCIVIQTEMMDIASAQHVKAPLA
jgi:hypothetical protein